MAETADTLPRLHALRTLVVLVMAVGYSSTMPLGPDAREMGTVFGVQPSWLAVEVLFAISGFLALRSLHRHGSGLRLLASRARRNLPLLMLVTAVVVSIVYPALRVGEGPEAGMSVRDLARYFLLTASCADPGQVMPGALDDAHYACLLQGAVWTFRWGALAYILSAVAWRIGLLRPRAVVLAGAAAGVALHFAVHWLAATTHPELLPAATGLRLLSAFAVGLALFHLPAPTARVAWVGTALALGVAALNHHLLPWTPLIALALFTACALPAFALLRGTGGAFRWTENWTPLALPLFLLNWPVAQIWLHFQPAVTPLELVLVTLGTTVTVAVALRAHAFAQLDRSPESPPPLSQAKSARTA